MSGRSEGYYGPSQDDLGKGCLLPVFAVVSVILVMALAVMSFQDVGDPSATPVSQAEQAESEAAEPEHHSDIAIDVTDSQAMHGAGLPTKADVLAWHMYGRWGFGAVEDGVHTVNTWEDLPGGAWVWDSLYGLDNANPAFKFR